MTALVIGVVAWWIAEGSNLVQLIKWVFKFERLKPFDCPKCLGFWIGVLYSIYLIQTGGACLVYIVLPILSSAAALFISKIYKGI